MIGKRFLPSTLFARVLLILLLPTVFIQAVMLYVFFERHWDNVARHISKALAGEVVFIVEQMKDSPGAQMPATIADFQAATDVDVFIEPVGSFDRSINTDVFPEFQDQLRAQISQSFTVRKIGDDTVETRILLPKKMLRIQVPVKRLESRTTIILVLWMFGATVLFLWIASLFLRNQIRPIRKLAKAADDFGRGVDALEFKPSGAAEVRTAARAFIVMRDRIRRQLRTRTEMLAGISHDLRTPLTRMKLELAMLGDSEPIRELKDDVQQMEHMIEEYLDFARGDAGEETERVSLRQLLLDTVADYERLQANVRLDASQDVLIDIRVSGFRRMLHNLIDNALRYGKRCHITLKPMANVCEIQIDDDGPGIPEEKREEVFQAFRRLDPSRNSKTGGVGLGLTIARDIVISHGGTIALATSLSGGLRVIVRLPLTKEAT